jgi:hypothetical protein
MKVKRLLIAVGLLLPALFFVLRPTSAQTGSSTITGKVADPSGSSVSGAKVIATNVETGLIYPTKTNDDGLYTFPSLSPGNYTITVEQTGFAKSIHPDIKLHVADTVAIDVTLTIGAVGETVTVTGGAPLVDTTTSSLGGLVDAKQIETLPLNGRNYISLTLMQPGVTLDANEQQNGIYAGSWFSSNGAPIRSNNFMIDGAIMQDQNAGSTADFAGRTLGLDGIAEFRVLDNAIPAEYGVTMGSQTVMASRGGTSSYHGNVFDYLRNSALDAANRFDARVQADNYRRLPEFQRNNFGGSFGGPILKDKTFFFLAFEGVKEHKGITNIVNVPAPGCHGPAGAVVWNGIGIRPAGSIGPCTQLGGTSSQTVTISSATAPLLALYPISNLSSPLQASLPYDQPDSDYFGQARIDHKISDRDSVFARYTVMDDDIVLSLPFAEYFTNPKVTRHQYITLSEDHIFTPWMLNTFRASFSRTYADRYGTNPLTAPEYQFLAGSAYPGIGQLAVGGLTTFGPAANPVSLTKQNILTFSDDITVSIGKHDMKFGAIGNNYRIYGLNPTGAQGTLSFGNLSTFMQGTASSFSGVAPGSKLDRTYQFWILGFYAQDDWRPLKNLTLNLGLRYEPSPGYYTEVHGESATLGNRTTDATPTVGPLFDHNPTLMTFGPRLGFAWDVFGNGKTALRGGAAILYDLGNLVDAFNIIKSQPPFSAAASVAGPIAVTSLPIAIPSSAATKDFWMFEYRYKQPRLVTENLAVEQQLPWSMSLNIAYAGSRGIHLVSNREGNPNVAQNVAQYPGGLFWPAVGVRQNPNWGSINWITPSGESNFNAMEISVARRATKGLSYQSSYTWGRTIDDGQGGRNDCTSSTAVGSNPYNFRFDRSISCFSTPNTWVLNFDYEFPSPEFGNRYLGALARGWGIMGIYSTHGGFPFNVWETTERARSGYFSGTATPPVDRPSWNPNFTGKVINKGVTQYYNPNAFILQPVGTLGTVGRDSLYGPGYSALDFAVQKRMTMRALGDNRYIQLRAELFNILNHPNLGEPNSAVLAGTLTDTTETPISTAGQITSTNNNTSRQVELSARIVF